MAGPKDRVRRRDTLNRCRTFSPRILLAVALLSILGYVSRAPAQQTGNFTAPFVARFNLTHGKYLVDIGQYLEALEAFNTAIELTDDDTVSTEAMLQKALVLAVFLDAPDEAIRVYDALLAQYPKSSAAESAVFRAAMVLFDSAEYTRAARYFERYLQDFPNGPSHGSAEFLLEQCRTRTEVTPTTAPSPSAPMPTPPAAAATAAPATPAVPISVTPSAAPLTVAAPRAVVSTPAARIPATAPVLPPTLAALPTVVPSPVAVPSTIQVRVRVLKGHNTVRVESDRPLSVTPQFETGRALELKAHDGLVLAGTQKGTREVTIVADAPLAILTGGATLHYHGSLAIRADGDALQIINRVGIEPYLYAVVTKESVASWPLEALKAQAIASRTYALYQVQHRQDRDYDMVDDEGSQVYGGVEGESATGRRAVDETRSLILEYRGRPIFAMFTANSGWYTGDSGFIFDQPLPYLVAVADPHSPGEPMGRWTRTYSASEIREKLAEIGVHLGSIRGIEPKLSCPSGRIVRADISDEHGSHVMRTRPTLGRALKLPEILLTVQHNGDQFVFTGGGFGHGIGLSQWGAKAMAAKGFNAKDILAFYYHGAEITALTQ